MPFLTKNVDFNILTEADSNKIQNVNRLYFCHVKIKVSLQSVKKRSDNNMPNRILIDCQKKTPFYPYGGIARLFNTRVLYCTLLLYQYCTIKPVSRTGTCFSTPFCRMCFYPVRTYMPLVRCMR